MFSSNDIAQLCINHYKKLPKSGKPNEQEWTILSAIILKYSTNKLKILSLATGSKCLPQTSLSSNGTLINDSHAEVLARRGFLRYVYDEIEELLNKSSYKSDLLEYVKVDDKLESTIFPLFKQKNGTRLYFYCSHTPCGDCSIIPKETDEKLEQEKEENDFIGPPLKKTKIGDIHRTGAKCVPMSIIQDTYEEGSSYHTVKAVRTKPGRGPPTISMSCSDKMSKWLVLGIQGSLLSNFLDKPIYLDEIIIGKCPLSMESMTRGLVERTSEIKSLPENYRLSKPNISQSDLLFDDSKLSKETYGLKKSLNACPTSICWSNVKQNQSCVLVRGNLLGMTQKTSKSKKYPLISKFEFLRRFVKFSKQEKITYNTAKLMNQSYNKALEMFYQNEIFSNWIRTNRDEYYQFKIE